jgi:hypothetical protein
MIKDRPKHLLDQDDYKKLPAKPFAVQFDALPELVREALGPLGGIQPVTGAMLKAANGQLRDMPSEGEIKLFQEKGTLFQPVFLVLSIAHLKDVNGTSVATPYACLDELLAQPVGRTQKFTGKDVRLHLFALTGRIALNLSRATIDRITAARPCLRHRLWRQARLEQ